MFLFYQRGPRYFDPPDSGWGACYNCGEEGHAAVNCTAAKRKKPCFVCGSLEHNVKQCTMVCVVYFSHTHNIILTVMVPWIQIQLI